MKFFWKYKLEHVLFWVVTILFHAFLSRTLIQRAGTFFFISEIIVRNGLLAIICYTNILYLFPRFFKPGLFFTNTKEDRRQIIF